MESYTDEYAFECHQQPQQQPMINILPSTSAVTHGTHAETSIRSYSTPYSYSIQRQQEQQPQHEKRHPIIFLRSPRLSALSKRSPFNQDRSLLVDALLKSTGILESMEIIETCPATIEELRTYHAAEYLTAMANYALFSQRQLSVYGLEDDCSPFPGLFEYAALCAGGSLQAAAALATGKSRIAINLDGGRHHARRAAASGFCYVNDVVISILRLSDVFQRVMYVDIDVHHGDGVEEAFEATDRVLTVSMHRFDPGFFPGSGAFGSKGSGQGVGFALNLPLGEGLKDSLFCAAFESLVGGAAQMYRPECIVLQW